MARVTVTEYGPEDSPGLTEFEASTGRTRQELAMLLAACSSRLQTELALPDPPIVTGAERISVAGCAGLIELAPRIELEVSPKFLGREEANWREDFFVFAALSRYGRLLDTDVVSGGYGSPKDLGTLIGRSALRLHDKNKRQPLRLYRRVSWTSFDMDGEVDEEEVLVPGPDGFQQSEVRLERDNTFTRHIGAAFRVLQTEVSEPTTRKRLERVALSYPTMTSVARRPPARVPARFSGWQPLYELAAMILRGLRVDYSGHDLSALGYAIKTADGWQDFLTLALETDLGLEAVHRGEQYTLGARATEAVATAPDITIRRDGLHFLVDAKYKGRAIKPQTAISQSDLYEANGFAQAAKVNRVVLAYPRTAAMPRVPLGAIEVFDEVRIKDTGISVVGVQVECRGISAQGGFSLFSRTLGDGILALGA